MTQRADGVARVLVVDDDTDMGEMVAACVKSLGHEPAFVSRPEEALSRLPAGEYGLVITDVQMGTMDGIALCEQIAEAHPDLPVIVLTGHSNLETAVRAMRAGAYDFLTKPIDVDMLAIAMERALEHRSLRQEVRRLQSEVVRAQPSRSLIGSSRAMREVLSLIERVASTDATVLVTGESGTGKELVARAIHGMSPRAKGAFVAINCAAVPANLLESELFGHVRGAFTDARNARAGLFLEANGGTLFLDEVGEMPLEMQAKLLRALQERTVRPVGGDRETPFDARVITATNRDLEAEVRERRFREDLFYRIAVVNVEVPTLRERAVDVPVLAQHFLMRFAERFGKKVVGFHPATLARLTAYAWPGNVRELENCVERSVALTRYDHVTVEDLPEKVRAYESKHAPAAPETEAELVTLSELERRYVQRVMTLVGGNKSRAARVLGLDRRTLYRMLEREANGDTTPPTSGSAGS